MISATDLGGEFELSDERGLGFRIALCDEIEDIGWRVNLGLNFPVRFTM